MQEVEIERLERELASVRVQLDSKEAAQKQALIKLDHYQKTIDELSSLLKTSDAKKNFYINQSVEATSRVAELESALQSECSAKDAEARRAREQEKEAQVEIALLKFQLHKGRSRLAAAEAAEARAQSEKTALYNALQQLGMEAEEAKRENRMLKEAVITAEPDQENKEIVGDEEMEGVKRELEAAVAKMGEMRTRLEQATSRAEAAERARAALEEQNRRRREHKERRKAAYAALRLETAAREFVDEGVENGRIYQPLGKVLNMKF